MIRLINSNSSERFSKPPPSATRPRLLQPEYDTLAADSQQPRDAWSMKENDESGFVYFIQAGKDGPVKIGIAADVKARLSELQTAHYEKLNIIKTINGGVLYERRLHKKFRHLRLRGEWFRGTAELMAFIGEAVDYLGDENPSPRVKHFHNLAKRRKGRKLSYNQAFGIITSHLTEVELSKQLGVSRSLIGAIRRRERWAGVWGK